MSPERSASGPRVLIIEDEVIVSMDLEQILRAEGYEIAGVAASCESAYELLAKIEIDFAILDVNLGKTTVFPLARRLRDHGTPFLFLSGYDRESALPEEFRDYECLEKPVADEILLRSAALLVGGSPSNRKSIDPR